MEADHQAVLTALAPGSRPARSCIPALSHTCSSIRKAAQEACGQKTEGTRAARRTRARRAHHRRRFKWAEVGRHIRQNCQPLALVGAVSDLVGGALQTTSSNVTSQGMLW